MKKAVGLTFLLLFAFIPMLVNADESNNDTLGPLEISPLARYSSTNIQILSPQNQSSISNPIQLHFSAEARTIAYCSFGSFGYSIDNGTIYNAEQYLHNTKITRYADNDIGKFWAKIALPTLTEGAHTIIVYYGYQNTGINQRYVVYAYSNVDFFVNSPTPSPSPTSPPVSTSIANSTPTPTSSVPQIAITWLIITAIALVTIVSITLIQSQKDR